MTNLSLAAVSIFDKDGSFYTMTKHTLSKGKDGNPSASRIERALKSFAAKLSKDCLKLLREFFLERKLYRRFYSESASEKTG